MQELESGCRRAFGVRGNHTGGGARLHPGRGAACRPHDGAALARREPRGALDREPARPGAAPVPPRRGLGRGHAPAGGERGREGHPAARAAREHRAAAPGDRALAGHHGSAGRVARPRAPAARVRPLAGQGGRAHRPASGARDAGRRLGARRRELREGPARGPARGHALDGLRVARLLGGRSLRELHAERERRAAGPARAGAPEQGALLRQGRENGPDADQDGHRADAGAARPPGGRLDQRQLSGQRGRREPLRPGQRRREAAQQDRRAGPDPRATRWTPTSWTSATTGRGATSRSRGTASTSPASAACPCSSSSTPSAQTRCSRRRC